MNKIKEFIRNISPFNNRTEMPVFLYIIKVILIFLAFKFGAELTGEVFAIALHFACGKNPLNGEIFDNSTIILITYMGCGIMTGMIFLFWKLFQKKTPAELGFTKQVKSLFAGMAAGLVLAVLSAAAVTLTGAISYNGLFGNIDLKMIALMFIAFIFQGSMEEVLCRGVVFKLLQNRTSVPVTVSVSTALFIIPHLSKMAGGGPYVTTVAVVNLILISVIFSLLTLRSGSIWAACGLHSVWNFILNSILGLNLSGEDEIIAAVFDMRSVGENVLNGGMYGIEASIITTAVLAAAVFLILIFGRKTAPAFCYNESHGKAVQAR